MQQSVPLEKRLVEAKLAERYNKLKEEGVKVEVIFISSDRDEDGFNGYYGDMPWLALPFNERDVKTKVNEKFGVSGIPTLVILNSDGSKSNAQGRAAVMNAPDTWVP